MSRPEAGHLDDLGTGPATECCQAMRDYFTTHRAEVTFAIESTFRESLSQRPESGE